VLVGLAGGSLAPVRSPQPAHAQGLFGEQSPSNGGRSAEQPPADQAVSNGGGQAVSDTQPGFWQGAAGAFGYDAPLPEAYWYAQQWQQAQFLATAQQWQQAQATLALWSQSLLAANLLAQQPATPPVPSVPPVPPVTSAPSNDRGRLLQTLTPDGQGLCGLAAGHTCQVGGDLAGSTVTPLSGTGAASASQWRVVLPAGRLIAGSIATVSVPTTRGIELLACPVATAGAQTVCTGQTRGHALQRGTVRVHAGNAVVAQGTVSGPGPSIQKLLIVVPGIDPLQSNTLYDPYQRASNNFGSAVCSGFSPCTALFPTLGCPSQSGGPSTVLVPCSSGGLAWLPYSYAGASGNGTNGLPLLYTGADTGQRLARSSTAMGQIVALARSLLGPSAASTQIVLIGHSLGGAVSSDWAGANAPDLTVITMDSPVNGIWPTDDSIFSPYCSNSTGLLDVYNLSTLLCRGLADVPALNSSVVPDLQASANIAREGLANAVNFFNPADVIVPSWYAVNRGARRGAVQFVSNCGASDFNHSCILGYAPAVTAAAAIITSGTYPAPTLIRPSINLNVTVMLDGSPAPNVPITVTQGSTPGCTTDCNPPSTIVATATTGLQGTATVSVPWRDSLVTANVGTTFGSNCQAGALPANNTDLNVQIRALRLIGCDLSAAPASR
jgi:hypothetical protein